MVVIGDADTPLVAGNDVVVSENNQLSAGDPPSQPLDVIIEQSDDDIDGSESLGVVFALPMIPGETSPIGKITVDLSDPVDAERFEFAQQDGNFTLLVKMDDPVFASNSAAQALAINGLFASGKIEFVPAVDYSGDPTNDVIEVIALSTEAADGSDVLNKVATATEILNVIIEPLSESPSTSPSASPSLSPTSSPSASPSTSPSASPTSSPSATPSVSPSAGPSAGPSASPSMSPSGSPTDSPSTSPSDAPSEADFPLTLDNGQSQIIEDVVYPDFGSDIIDSIDFVDGSPFNITAMNDAVDGLTIDGIPPGTVLTWNGGANIFTPSGNTPGTLVLTSPAIGDQISDLSIVAPPNTDGDFVLNVTLESSEDILDDVGSFFYEVLVDADADVPAVIHTDPIVVLVPWSFGRLKIRGVASA